MKTLQTLACLQIIVGVGLIAKTSFHNQSQRTPQAHNPVIINPLKIKRKTSNYSPLLPTLTPSTTPSASKKISPLLNDPDISKNWGLRVSAALQAQGITTGSRKIKVAIIDTGIDVHHRDLKNNLWKNPGETGLDKNGKNKATNGIDDDKNGFVDDVHGWNFVSNNNQLTDNHGHGTHIAGIIGAEGGNKFGITGISPKVSLMVIKFFDPNHNGDHLKNTIKGIEYAIANGANIINYSGGGTEYSSAEYEAIRKARSKGILVVAAAGNERSNSDQKKYYPANYNLDNIISVTAINPQLKVLSSSNYGTTTVDIAAPGEDIYSTKPGNTFDTLTGTSQATAFVSGLAALILANNSDFNYKAIKKHILRTGDEYPWLKSKTGTSKKLNIYKALTALDTGIAASGAIAANTTTFQKSSFSSEGGFASNSTGNGLVGLSRRLMKTYGDNDKRRINNN